MNVFQHLPGGELASATPGHWRSAPARAMYASRYSWLLVTPVKLSSICSRRASLKREETNSGAKPAAPCGMV